MSDGAQIFGLVDPKAYNLIVLPGNLSEKRELAAYYAGAYRHWKKIWQRVFKHIEGEEAFNPDDFLKHTNIFSIFHGDTVVAQICSRILNVGDEITLDIPYFKDIGVPIFTDLMSSEVQRIMTLEFNALNPIYSKRRSGFPFADALLFLCFEAARSLNVSCCTAVPRRITKVQDTLFKMNFKTVLKSFIRYNCPVDVMLGYVDQIPQAQDVTLATFVTSLWERRIDHNKDTGVIIQKQKITEQTIPECQTL